MEPLVEIVESVHIAAPPQRVWALVTDVRRHPEFAGPQSITKAIDLEGSLREGSRWIAHERFGPQRFDAPSEVTRLDPDREFAWVSYPPMKEKNRGEGGRVLWSYRLTPEEGGCRLEHTMQVLQPAKGAGPMKAMYKVFSLPKRQREGVRITLAAIKQAAETAPNGPANNSAGNL